MKQIKEVTSHQVENFWKLLAQQAPEAVSISRLKVGSDKFTDSKSVNGH